MRSAAESWSKADGCYIAYTITERAENLSVALFSAGWPDLGENDIIRERDVCACGQGVKCQNAALQHGGVLANRTANLWSNL